MVKGPTHFERTTKVLFLKLGQIAVGQQEMRRIKLLPWTGWPVIGLSDWSTEDRQLAFIDRRLSHRLLTQSMQDPASWAVLVASCSLCVCHRAWPPLWTYDLAHSLCSVSALRHATSTCVHTPTDHTHLQSLPPPPPRVPHTCTSSLNSLKHSYPFSHYVIHTPL